MNSYKIYEPCSIFKSINKKKAVLDRSEDDGSKILDNQTLNSFLNEISTYIKFLSEFNFLDEENVNISINAFNNFAQYSPKDKIAEVIIESKAIDCLVNYCSNDISGSLANPIVQQNFISVFNIFGEMSKSKNYLILLAMIQKGVLSLCINNYSILDDDFNSNISFIMNNFIISSFFARSLVYSTGIFSSIVSTAEESYAIPILMCKFISGITTIFISKSPSLGYEYTDEIEDIPKPHNECLEFWDNFMENYYGEPIFDKELFTDFVTNGIDFSKGQPIYEIVNFLISLDDELCILNGLKCLWYLVSRDCGVKNDNPLCEEIISNRIPFLEIFPVFIETNNYEIIECALQILINATFPNNLPYNYTILNDIAKLVIDYIIDLEKNFDEEIIICAARALNNISININSFDCIEDDTECERLLLLIYQCLRNGSFKVRKESLFFFMTLAEEWIENSLIYKAVGENMAEIISISESALNVKLNLHILSSLTVIFEHDEQIGDEFLLSKFKSNNGFEMTYSFQTDDSNQELSEKAEDFNNKFYGDLPNPIINDILSSYIIDGGDDDDDDVFEEDQPNFGDLYYKKKGGKE